MHLEWNGKKAVVSGKWIKKEIQKLAKKLDTYNKTVFHPYNTRLFAGL